MGEGMKVNRAYFLPDEEYKKYWDWYYKRICLLCGKPSGEHCRCGYCDDGNHNRPAVYDDAPEEMRLIFEKIQRYQKSWSNERQCNWVEEAGVKG
jgi:hypothetical protein